MKIITVLGARPQFIKAAPMSKLLAHEGINEIIIHTGQHFDPQMSQVFFDEMKLPTPKYNLGIHGVNHGAMTGKMLEQIELILLKENPNFVMVYGDTNSTLAGALAAKKLAIKVIHIEAGLRSHNLDMPEEINRILTDRISSLLFCPTIEAVNNLRLEGYDNFSCHYQLVGDVMYDAFLYFQKYQKSVHPPIEQPYILATIHRVENTDNVEILENIVNFLNEVNAQYKVVIPLHPRTRNKLLQDNIKLDASIIDPVGYLEMLWLLNNCKIVLTDSGGLQKEAYFAQKKCITLRSETEWIELVKNGWNQLMNPKQKLDANDIKYSTPKNHESLYGNGDSCRKIIETIKKCVE